MVRILCALLIILCLFGCSKEPTPPFKPKENPMISKADKFYFIGMEEAIYSQEQNKHTVLKAETVIHRKKRLGFLSLNFFDIIEATDVQITTTNKEQDNHIPKSDNQRDDDLYNVIKKGVSNLKLENNISELIVNNIKIEFIDYKTIKSLSAGQITIDTLKQKLVFNKGLIIESPTQNKLIAKNAVWKSKNKKLYIPGKYIIKKDKLIIDSGSKSFLSIYNGNIKATQINPVHN